MKVKTMENSILINELTINKEGVKELKELVESYFKNKQLINELLQKEEEILNQLSASNYKSIGVEDLNTKITITPSKEVKKIDYEETLKAVEDKETFKKDKISRVWDDAKIEEQLNVIYKTEKTTIRITTTKLMKEDK